MPVLIVREGFPEPCFAIRNILQSISEQFSEHGIDIGNDSVFIFQDHSEGSIVRKGLEPLSLVI